LFDCLIVTLRVCGARRVSVVILCGSEHFVRDFMLAAHEMGMTSGEYVYVVVAQVPPGNVKTPWLAGIHDDEDETARLAFHSVLQVRAFLLRACPVLPNVNSPTHRLYLARTLRILSMLRSGFSTAN